MSVRDPNLPVRRHAIPRRDEGGPGPRRSLDLSRVIVALLFVALLAGTVGFVFAALGPPPADPSPSPARSGTGTPAVTDPAASGASAPPVASGSLPATTPAASPGASASVDPSQTASPAPTDGAVVDVVMPVVPVVGFWDMRIAGLSAREVRQALEDGAAAGYERVIVPEADREAIGRSLGVQVAGSVETGDAPAIRDAVRDGALGFLRASDVSQRVRALRIDDRSLFGTDRVRADRDWPLAITVSVPSSQAWDQAAVVTIVAGGDSMMDRGIYERVVNRGLGIGYPFDGGTVEITGRYCCGPYVCCFEVPSFRKSGNRGAVRRIVRDADLAITNLENPVPDDWVFHLRGTRFSGKPALLEIFTDAGIDWVSLANNHIYDYGSDGIADTERHLERFGLAYAGAGQDLDAARRYSTVDVQGQQVAILPCVAITPNIWASPNGAGAMPCTDEALVPNIEEAAASADIVIVFPSWGPEYTPDPRGIQRRLGARWIRAGADLVLGFGHHQVAAIEEVDDRLVLYSIGNFIFDQNWRESTMEGIMPELTFHGGRLVQMEMNPFLTLDQSQPNLLDPATDGDAVFGVMRRASEGMLDY